MKTYYVFLIFCLPALADFNKATLDQYIFHIQKYAESNCENVKEINLAGDANKQIFYAMLCLASEMECSQA